MSNRSRRIGIVGCGAIGSEIARAVDRGDIPASISGIFDTDTAAAKHLSNSLSQNPPVIEPETLVADCDIIVECAGGGAVDGLAEICARSGTDLVVMSVGGITATHFELFENSDAYLYIPSGAIAGIDGIAALACEGVDSLTLTTRKPPAGLKGAPFLVENNISVDDLSEPLTVFEGPPAEAICGFPKNVNVSTTLALASCAADQLKVRIIADPTIKTNIHEVEIKSPLGDLSIRVVNKPSPSNPKTSALAYLSAIATLKKIMSKVKIGT